MSQNVVCSVMLCIICVSYIHLSMQLVYMLIYNIRSHAKYVHRQTDSQKKQVCQLGSIAHSAVLSYWKYKQSRECAELSCQQLARAHMENMCLSFPDQKRPAQDKEGIVRVLIGSNICMWGIC